MYPGKQKRAERRLKQDFGALILLGGFARRDCKVVDMSEGGARLAIDGKTELPKTFSVVFAPNASGKACQLVWRNGRMVGVKFVK